MVPMNSPLKGDVRWAPRSGASRSVGAGRKHSGSPRSEDLPSVALNTQQALCEPVPSVFPIHRSSTFSKIPCKFPANSLLPQKKSLLGIQKFPAPLRREFGCKPMDSLTEWRRKLANEPKSSKIPCKFPASREFEAGDRSDQDCVVSQPVRSLRCDFQVWENRRHFRALAGNGRVFGEENRALPTEGGVFLDESLLHEFSISGI